MPRGERPAEDDHSRQELARLLSEHGPDWLRDELSRLLPAKIGRPRGTGINDTQALLHMGRLLRSGETPDRTKAARDAVRRGLAERQSEESAIRRLRDKYTKKEALVLRALDVAQELSDHLKDLRAEYEAHFPPLFAELEKLAALTESWLAPERLEATTAVIGELRLQLRAALERAEKNSLFLSLEEKADT